MNAIDFLINEHSRVKKILADISDKSHRFHTKRKMFDLLSSDLIRHEKMEQEVWYPRFKNSLSDRVKHLVDEDPDVKKFIKKIDALKFEEAWENNFLKFKEEVEQHVTEEENKLFPEVEKLFSPSELERIGLQMHHFKRNYNQIKKN